MNYYEVLKLLEKRFNEKCIEHEMEIKLIQLPEYDEEKKDIQEDYMFCDDERKIPRLHVYITLHIDTLFLNLRKRSMKVQVREEDEIIPVPLNVYYDKAPIIDTFGKLIFHYKFELEIDIDDLIPLNGLTLF